MLAAGLRRIDDQQLPASIRGVTKEMFETLAPEMEGLNRVALSNLWLFAPLVQRQLEQGPVTNAMARTTTALTMLQAGIKDNVMPATAQATINFRLYPGDSQAAVIEHVKRTAGSGRYEVIALPGASEASPVSPTSSASWTLLGQSVRTAFPDAVVAPGLVMGGTDSKHFVDLSDHIYRFSPVRVRPDDAGRIHGVDERLGVGNYGEMITFYYHLLRGSASPAF
jgi:carboxypeptidase PM20D1